MTFKQDKRDLNAGIAALKVLNDKLTALLTEPELGVVTYLYVVAKTIESMAKIVGARPKAAPSVKVEVISI